MKKASKIAFAIETKVPWLSALMRMVKLFEKETRHCNAKIVSITKINLKSQHLHRHYLPSWSQIRTILYLEIVSSPSSLDVRYQQVY